MKRRLFLFLVLFMSIPFSYGCAKPEPVVPDTLFFTFNGNGCTISNQAEYKTEISLGDRDLVFNILPDNGHVLPRKIETEAKGVTYNPTDGLIKIAKVTENVNVTATAPNGYHLSFTGSHCGIDGYHLYEADFIEGEDDRDINLLVEPENDKYVLPTKVEGLQDGMSYNPETGMIHIDQIKSPLNLTAISNYIYQLTLEGTNCTIKGDPQFTADLIEGATNIQYTITPSPGFILPRLDDVKFDGEGKENASYNPETGTITISKVTGSVNVTAETNDRYPITVTFDKDNGEDDSKQVTYAGYPISPISNPAKQDSIYNYIFKGWYKVNKGGMEEEEFDFTDPDNYYDDFTVKAKWEQGSRQTYYAEATNANHLEFTTIDGKPLGYDLNVKAGLEYKFKMNAINNSSNPTPEYTVPNILTIKVGDDEGDLPLTAGEYTIEANADRTSATVTISDKKTLYNIHISSDKGAVRQGTYNYEIAGLFGLEEIQGGTHDTSTGPLQLTFTPTGSYSSPKGENIYVYFDGIGEYVSPAEGYPYCKYENNVLTIVDTYIVNSISIVARANDYELLNNLTWKQISSIGTMGYAQYLFYIGEKKTVTLYGNVHRVMIIDFYKDVEYTAQAPYCPMTFQFYDIVTKNSGSPYQTAWNNDGHEKGDNFNYPTSQLQNFLSNDIYKNLPNDTNADALRPYIKLVGKEVQISEDGGKTYIKRPFSAHLFNLSTGEYDKGWGWGEGIYSYYDIYKTDFQKSAVNGGVSQYWTRSQAECQGIYYRAWVMRTDRKYFTNYKVINKSACAPGFCI